MENLRYDLGHCGSWLLIVELDGLAVSIGREQKLLWRFGAVKLFAHPADPLDRSHRRYTYTIPADPPGRPWPQIVPGATDHPAVAALTWRYIPDEESGRWFPGRRLDIPKKGKPATS